MIQATNISIYIEMIPDPRTCRLDHDFVGIVTIALLAKICGAEGWEDMEEFGLSRIDWLQSFLELRAGIPSPDTFRRVICHIDPTAFLEAFLEWIKAVQNIVPELINIDGKTLRSASKRGEHSLHIVSAWCDKNHMVLGHLRNDSKSNEVKAIPELLKQLVLPEGSIVTIDAAGTQKNIASQIRDMGADYVLALKANQPTLQDEVANYFDQAAEAGDEYALLNIFQTEERGHGRMEFRKIYATDDLDWLPQKNEWVGLRSIIKLDSVRWAEGKRQQEIKYYISSLPPEAETLSRVIRGHWSIESRCHWVLDVVFAEDRNPIVEGHAPENLRAVNLLAAKMLKEEKSCRKGIRAKRFKAALDNDYLHRVLLAANF